MRIIRFIRSHGLFFTGLLCFVCIVTAGYALLIYHRFVGSQISSEAKYWADFGAYAAGTAGVLLSFLNLLVLGYISYKSSSANQQRWETELRNTNFKELIKQLYKVNAKSKNGNNIQDLLDELNMSDLNNYFYLGGDEEKTLYIIQELLKGKLRGMFNSIANKPRTDFDSFYNEFEESKTDLIKMLSAKIMNRDNIVRDVIKKYLSASPKDTNIKP